VANRPWRRATTGFLKKYLQFARRAKRAIGSAWADGRKEEAASHERSETTAANRSNPDAIFVWVPKSAGTSVWQALASISAEKYLATEEIAAPVGHGINTFGHMSLPALIAGGWLDPDYFRRAFKFAFVRNPFDRAVSLFEFLKRRGNLPQATNFPIFCEFIRRQAYEPIGLYNRTELSQLNSQCTWLKDADGSYFCDFIGRYENLAEDWNTIRQRIGDKVALPSLGHYRKSERSDTAAYYTPDEVAIIQDAYREDFETFGYSTALT